MSVYETLIDTVRQHGAFHPLTAKESTEEYLKRLAKAVSAVTKTLFDDMPVEAQEWFDGAATAIAEQMPVPLPEGFSRENNVQPLRTRAPVVAPVKPAEPGRKPPRPRPTGSATPPMSPGLPPRPRPTVAAVAQAVAEEEDESITARITRMLVADQNLTIDDVRRQLQQQGITASDGTVRMARYNTLATIRFMRREGWQPPR